MPFVETVNTSPGRPHPRPSVSRFSGIGKEPTAGPVAVRAPGPRQGGLGSGLVGDFIGSRRHHGGDVQAVYAFPREDLDEWERMLGHALPNGSFGENLTTRDLEVQQAVVGERWLVGSPEDPMESVELQVTVPRIPCATFAAWLDERGWVKRFTTVARSGAYLRVLRPGRIRSGDPVQVLHRPDHGVTVQTVFRAITTERELLPGLLAAREYLEPETLAMAESGTTMVLDDA